MYKLQSAHPGIWCLVCECLEEQTLTSVPPPHIPTHTTLCCDVTTGNTPQHNRKRPQQATLNHTTQRGTTFGTHHMRHKTPLHSNQPHNASSHSPSTHDHWPQQITDHNTAHLSMTVHSSLSTVHSGTYSYRSLLIKMFSLSLKVLNKTDNR